MIDLMMPQYAGVSAVVESTEGIDEGMSMIKLDGEHILIDKLLDTEFITEGEDAGKFKITFDGTVVFAKNTERLAKGLIETIQRVSGFSNKEVNEATNDLLLEMLMEDAAKRGQLNGKAVRGWVSALWEIQINW